MATGYTACIKDGVSFREFVLRCARAMGVCVAMREEDSNIPPPEKFEPDSHYFENLEKAKEDLRVVEEMTEKEKELGAKAYNTRQKDNAKGYKKDNADLKAKYIEMLDKVESWEPPTEDHVNFKEFMLNQLNESIQFDCSTNEAAYKPKTMGKQHWYAEQLQLHKRNVKYYEEATEKEIKRTEEKNKWIGALYDSLKEEK
jgi:hypothetical protein